MRTSLGPVLCLGRAQVALRPLDGHQIPDAPGFAPAGAGLGRIGDVARWLGRLEVRVQVAARVGADGLGERYRKALTDAGVETTLLEICRELPTGVVFEDGEVIEHVGADADLGAAAATPEVLDRASLVYTSLSSMRPPGARKVCEKALAGARARGLPEALLLDFRPGPSWSRYEAQAVLQAALAPGTLALAAPRGLAALFPDFWDHDAILEGLRELGVEHAVLLEESGEVTVLAGPDVEGHELPVPVDDRSAGALHALVLRALRTGSALLEAAREATLDLPALLAGAPAPPDRIG